MTEVTRRRPTTTEIRAIEAELMQAVYDARRLARLRLLGVEPPPIATAPALRLYRRAAVA